MTDTLDRLNDAVYHIRRMLELNKLSTTNLRIVIELGQFSLHDLVNAIRHEFQYEGNMTISEMRWMPGERTTFRITVADATVDIMMRQPEGIPR